MRRQPGFAATIVVSLALAVGANAAVFSLVDLLLFRSPTGVVAPEGIRRVYANLPNARRAVNGRAIAEVFSYPEYRAIRAALAGVARVAAHGVWDSTAVAQGTDTVYATQGYATADFLPMLGVRMARGRTFTEEEDDVVVPVDVAVVTSRFARRAFGATRDPLEQTLMAHGRRYTVIGVIEGDFGGINVSAVDFWTPFSTRRPVPDRDADRWYTRQEPHIPLVVRVDSAVSDAVLESRATGAFRAAWPTKLKVYQGRSIVMGPVVAARGPGQTGQAVAISTRLAGVAIILLLVACANVTNLFLLRGVRRRREIAVRVALGVSRRRLAGQLFVESSMLALLAGVAATMAAAWTGGALRVALLPRVTWLLPPMTTRVLAFTVLMTVAVAVIAGGVPALLASHVNFGDALRSGPRDGVLRRSRLRGTLLAIQVALSLVLLAGAGLFLKSLRNVRGVDLGYDTARLVVASVQYLDQKPHPELATELPLAVARLARMPGVGAMTYATGAPLNSWHGGVELFAPNRDSAIASGEVGYNGVIPNYFATAGTRVLAGRGVLRSDAAMSEPVIVINETLARTAWPGENALGKCVMLDARTNPCRRIVGVVEDVHKFRIIEAPDAQFYLPITQDPRPEPRAIVARVSDAEAASVAAALGAELRRAFPKATVTARAAADILAPQLRPWQLGAHLFAGLGLLSLVVAAIGLYAIVSFELQQRTHELGVRMALGARGADVLRVVARQSLVAIAAGLAVGVGAALVSGRFVASLLYDVRPTDPATLVVSAVVLLGAGVVASGAPARRALRVDPAQVLRDE